MFSKFDRVESAQIIIHRKKSTLSISLLAGKLVLAHVRVHLPGTEDDAGKVAVVDGVRVGLGFQAESAMALIDCAPLAHEAAVPRHEVVCVELDARLIRDYLQHAATGLVLEFGRHPACGGCLPLSRRV